MAVTDCGGEGCDECDVCRYLNFLEWCSQVASGGAIQRNPAIEIHLDANLPGWRGK